MCRAVYFFLFTVHCILIPVYCFTQEIPPAVNIGEQKIEERIENVAQTVDESADLSELADNLRYFAEHRINLNNTSKEELQQLTLLSDQHIENLLKHIETNGKLLALQELQSIDLFDPVTIYTILPYIRISDVPVLNKSNRIFAEGKHQLILRTQRVLETQKGFLPPAEGASPGSYYLGGPWKFYTRYRFISSRKISFGITAEKDQGEEFFLGTQTSFDFYSAHLYVRDVGPIKALAIGDYQLEYGQGLTLWTGLAFGKSSEVMNIKKNAFGIKPYTSVNEDLYKRGGAVSFGYRKFQFDVFYSHKGFDGNLTDTLEQIEQFSSFQEGGYHRTLTELADKNSIKEIFYGGHLNYKSKHLTLGLTAARSSFDKSLTPSPTVYNTYYFKGDELTNAGIDYTYFFRNIHLFGEVSRSDNGSIAYLNGALISLDQRVAFSFLNRNYPRDYHTLFANSFRESSNNFNEKGTYFGLVIRPKNTFTLSGYFDVFTFEWLRYQVNAPSNGYEYLTQLTYIPHKKFSIYLRYRQTNKAENTSGDFTPVDYLINYTQSNYRIDAVTKISKSFTLHNRVELLTLDKPNREYETGFLIFQDVNYKPLGSPLSFSFRYALFDSKSYDSRLYAYENDVLYLYSIPAFYYRGSRYYITLRYKVMTGVDFWLRFSQTIYSNQNTVGSGLDEIDGNTKSEIKAQLRFEF